MGAFCLTRVNIIKLSEFRQEVTVKKIKILSYVSLTFDKTLTINTLLIKFTAFAFKSDRFMICPKQD